MQDIADECNANMLAEIQNFKAETDKIMDLMLKSVTEASQQATKRIYDHAMDFESNAAKKMDQWRGADKAPATSPPLKTIYVKTAWLGDGSEQTKEEKQVLPSSNLGDAP